MDSMGDAGYAAPAQRPFNPLEALIGVIIRPVEAMRQIAAARPWVFAIILSIVSALLSGLANLPGRDRTLDQFANTGLDARTQETFENFVGFFLSPAFAIGSALTAPLWLALGSGILYLCGRLLGGRGPYSAMFSTEAFTAIPGILLAPLTAVFNLVGGPVATIGGCLAFFVGIWALVLTVLAIRESLNLSTGRAVGALLIPVAVLLALSCVLTLVAVGLAAGASS